MVWKTYCMYHDLNAQVIWAHDIVCLQLKVTFSCIFLVFLFLLSSLQSSNAPPASLSVSPSELVVRSVVFLWSFCFRDEMKSSKRSKAITAQWTRLRSSSLSSSQEKVARAPRDPNNHQLMSFLHTLESHRWACVGLLLIYAHVCLRVSVWQRQIESCAPFARKQLCIL